LPLQMKILFDGQVYLFQKAGGINRYFAEIIAGLPAAWMPVMTGVKDFGSNVPHHPNLSIHNPPHFRPGRLRERFYRHWWRPRLAEKVQLLHPTYYELTSGFKLSDFKCPVVTTVHDMVYARFPKQIDGAEHIIQAQRASVLRADKVICISKSTENELMEFIPEAAGKTTIIYHGSSFPPLASSNEAELFKLPTFLFVGYRGGYKNFSMVLRAFARASGGNSALRLKVVGPALFPEERWQIHFLGISDKVISLVYPDEKTLQESYQSSVALLYPSRYEGFGIPPLEAMSCGTIPVTANATSLPEVVGDGGIMLDPADEDSWADCIAKLARPFPGRADLLERGRNRVKLFTWKDCAERHRSLYQELI